MNLKYPRGMGWGRVIYDIEVCYSMLIDHVIHEMEIALEAR